MIVFCDGMLRSASTWAFNVCAKLLAILSPGASMYTGFHERPGELLSSMGCQYDHLVVKSHTLDAVARTLCRLGAARVVYTYRDPYDAIASYMLMFRRPFDEALVAIRDSLLLYKFHRETGNYHAVAYESVIQAPEKAIAGVSSYLGLDAPREVVTRVHGETCFEAMKQIADRLRERDPTDLVQLGDHVYDPQTLIHPGHVRDGASGYGRRLLSPEQRRCVAEAVRGLVPDV